MKKYLLFALVLAVAVAFAAPASAFKIEGAKDTKFYFGGLAMTDFGYWGRDASLANANGTRTDDDLRQFILSVPRDSKLRGSVQAANVGMYWELGLGSDLIRSHEQGDTNNAADKFSAESYLEMRKLYGFMTFGNCTLMIGKNDGSFFALGSASMLGLEQNNHRINLGWGALYDNRLTQIRFRQDVSKTFAWQAAFVQPFVSDVNVASGGTITNFDSIAKFPRVDARVEMNFGAVSIMPGGTWQQIVYDSNPPGYDSSADIWAVVLPVKVTAGAFGFAGAVAYGQNLWKFTFQSAFHAPAYSATGKVQNATGLMAFADFSFSAGAITPHFIIGYDKAENTDRYKVGDSSNTRMAYTALVQWKVADNFFVNPEFAYYNYGKVPGVPNAPDIGNEWLAGINFQFVF